MPLAIDYDLVGTGWATCTISDGETSCKLTASYLSDALHSLLVAAVAVSRQFRSVTFGFDEEPGEYRWVITSPRLNEIQLEILGFTKLWGDEPDAQGKVLFSTVCLPETFARAVHWAAQKVLAKYG